MAGQGAAIREIANAMKQSGWTVLFVCVPNTPHIGVIPIPTGGITRQCYTDIVAFRDLVLKLIEVETVLNEKVAEDIASRLSEQRAALRRLATWREWSSRVAASTGTKLPESPVIECELVVIRSIRTFESGALSILRKADVLLRSVEDFKNNTGRGSIS